MKIKEKPKIGTRLVPSIENIEGCYKHGGKWDHVDKICYETHIPEHFPRDEGYDGCTAPIKGISVCWGSRPRDKIVFFDHILSVTGDIVHSKSIRLDYVSSGQPDAINEYSDIKNSGNKKLSEKKNFICINPMGKIINCSNPNTIFTNKGKNITAITHNLRRYLKQKPLSNIRPRMYTPMDLEYKKGHQMEIVHISDDLPVLMRKDRDKNNDKDYFPADTKKSLHPPLNEMEVPSIESIRHCFDNGGYWNGFWHVCIRDGCVGPHKGVECHFTATETEDVRIISGKNEPYDEEWDTRFEPNVWCKIAGKQKPDEDFWNEDRLVWDSSYDGYFSDYWDQRDFGGYRYPDDYDTALEAAKSVAIDTMNDIVRGVHVCFTPEGRKVHTSHPRAICAPKEKVLKIYKGKQ